MIKAVILDDEASGSSLLQYKLQGFASIISVAKIFNDPLIALQEIHELKPDVLFLDVEMPAMNGFQFLEQISYFSFEVIFVTAYNIYTLDALRAGALDYLLKPVDPDELGKALNKLKAKMLSKANLDSNAAKDQNDDARIVLHTAEGIYFVKRQELIKIEAMSNYSIFYLANRSKIIVSRTLKEYEALLDGPQFIRVNRGVIINLTYVLRYKKGDGGTLELIDGSEIEVSSSRKALLLERLAIN